MKEFEEKVKASEAEKSLEDADMGKVAGGHAGFNPGCGYDASEYVYQKDGLEAGRYYDYTFYMLPTVYTVAPGHHLALVLTSWDPYRAFLDEDYQLDPDRDPSYSFFTYAFTVDNTSLGARIPVK